MARKKQPTETPAETSVQSSPTQSALPMVVAEGWYDMVVYDIDPEYHSQKSTTVFVVLKCRISGSMRYGAKSFALYIGEHLSAEANGKRFDSARKQMADRFGIDPWVDYEKYLDLPIRGHIATVTAQGKTVNRLVSIYPRNAQKDATDAAIQDELPL